MTVLATSFLIEFMISSSRFRLGSIASVFAVKIGEYPCCVA